MILKITLRSHFKFGKSKTKDKKIFLKNIVILLLFSKIFFKSSKLTLSFSKIQAERISLLRAPSRHKRFFHQIWFEYFNIKVFIFYENIFLLHLYKSCLVFQKLKESIFKKLGNNILSRVKLLSVVNIKQVLVY